MASNPYVNKVEYGDQTLIDLTEDTVSPNNVLLGATFHNAAGASQVGAVITHDVVDNLNSTSSSDALSAKQGHVLDEKVTTHDGKAVASQNGAHGLRYYSDKLEYYDTTESAWTEIPTGGGGTTIVQIPSVVIGEYSYTGSDQGPTITGLDTTHCNVSGTTEATNVGQYTFTISLKDPTTMVWTDMTTAPKTYTWEIEKAVVTVPTVTVGTYTYDGTAQGPTITGLDTTKTTITNATATNAGSYTLAIALNNTAGMEWSDGTTADKTYAYTIDKVSVTIPTVSDTSLTYNGSAQHPTVTDYDSSIMSRTGYEYTNAGSYTLSISLQDTTNYEWSDTTTTAKTTAWSIAKASASVTLSADSVRLDTSAQSATVTVSNGTGALTIASSDTTVATVSPASMSASGGTLTISSVNETNGTATVTLTIAGSENYEAGTATISVVCSFTGIYGVQWDGSSTTAWSRTDDAALFTDPNPAVNNGDGSSPFDGIMPWSGMVRVEDSDGGTLVRIPKYWYKWTRSGSSMKLQIANGPVEGFSVSPAHADRGDGEGERDYVYVGAYHCATSTYKSTTGVAPANNYTRAQFRNSISNLSSDIWQWDYAMLWTIQMLYLVEYADWNSQEKIGYGCSDAGSVQNSGLCDSMTYHTGTNAANRQTYGHTRYRYIEDLWGNVFDWCDGIYFSSANVFCIKNPANFSDSSGGTNVGSRATASGYIKGYTQPSVQGFEYALYPNLVDSSLDGSTYIGDYCSYNSSGVVLCVGGNYSQNQSYGLFCLNGVNTATNKNANIGSRLQKLP